MSLPSDGLKKVLDLVGNLYLDRHLGKILLISLAWFDSVRQRLLVDDDMDEGRE